MAASRQIIDLRNLLAERFQHPPAQAGGQISIPLLDRATNGGLRKSAITEIITPNMSAGSALLIHSLLKIAQRDRFFLALIDGGDSFDVQSVDATTLQHLLWVRCEKATEAIKAADFLLRDGNFLLVVLDLVLNPVEELRRIPATSWYRLQRLVEAAPTAFVVMSRHNMVASARTKIVLENRWTLPDLSRDNPGAQLYFKVRRAKTIASALG
jgi:recA bacterial DNA recombination protein